MLTDEEWSKLYSYLITRLKERGFREVADECRRAADARVVETDLLENPISEDPFKATFRTLRPREIFLAAFDVIRTRLREMPRLSSRLSDELEAAPENILWRSETAPDDVVAETHNFSAADFAVSDDDLREVERLIQFLEEALDFASLEKPEE